MAEQSTSCYIPARYVFTFLASVGLAIIYALKVNLSVAIVVMVNQTALTEMAMTSHNGNNRNGSSSFDPASVEFACPVQESYNQTNASSSPLPSKQDGPFAWPEPTQGLILAAYFWGYIFTQLPGGRVAEMFSAKWVIWGSVMINVVFTLLTPVAAQISYIAVLVVRFIEGLGAGVSLPAIQVMLSKWSLPDERNRLSAFVFAGMSMGTVVSLPFSGFLAETLGWQSVFYVLGGLATIWCILWIFLVYDSPQQHPRLHPEEKKLFFSFDGVVTEGITTKKKKLSVPWKAIFTSGPFWAILIAHTCKNFGWYMLLVELPTYMKHILRFNIGKNALLSAIPYFSLWFFSALWSFTMDWSKSKGWLTTTAIRKLSTSVATLLPALCFTGVCVAGCDRNAAIALMTLGAMFMAGAYCGILANSIDIASNYAGTLMAITNTFATIPGFVVPLFVGQLTHGNQSLERWQIIFGTTSGIMALAFVVYTLLASGEEQPWNKSCDIGNNLSSVAAAKEKTEEEEKLNPEQATTIDEIGNGSNNKNQSSVV